MSNKNINTIKDLLNINGVVMDAISLKQSFKLQTNIVILNSLLSAIPKSWKNVPTLKNKLPAFLCTLVKMTLYDKKITDIESKQIFWCLVKSKLITPSCIERWSKDNIVLPNNQ